MWFDISTIMVYKMAMRWDEYYRALKSDEREEYAQRVPTTTDYIEIHYLARPERRKIPRQPKRLADASLGECSLGDVLAYFYEEESEEEPATT